MANPRPEDLYALVLAREPERLQSDTSLVAGRSFTLYVNISEVGVAVLFDPPDGGERVMWSKAFDPDLNDQGQVLSLLQRVVIDLNLTLKRASDLCIGGIKLQAEDDVDLPASTWMLVVSVLSASEHDHVQRQVDLDRAYIEVMHASTIEVVVGNSLSELLA